MKAEGVFPSPPWPPPTPLLSDRMLWLPVPWESMSDCDPETVGRDDPETVAVDGSMEASPLSMYLRK